MPRKPTPSLDTTRILAAIESNHGRARLVAEAVRQELQTHTELDDSRHLENKATLAIIAADVKSLLDSRSFTRGVWKTASTAGGVMGGLVMILGLFLQWWRGH